MRVGKVRASDPDSSGRVLGSSPRGGAKATTNPDHEVRVFLFTKNLGSAPKPTRRLAGWGAKATTNPYHEVRVFN